MRGIKKLTVFSRKIVSAKNSELDLRAPNLKQTPKTQEPGDDGEPGRNGAPGPIGKGTLLSRKTKRAPAIPNKTFANKRLSFLITILSHFLLDLVYLLVIFFPGAISSTSTVFQKGLHILTSKSNEVHDGETRKWRWIFAFEGCEE